MALVKVAALLKVADEAWLATALLHRENPMKEDFSLSEILDRARREFHDERPGVWAHIVSHCVASNPPSPVRYRMLHESGRGRRRLFKDGDPAHPERTGKTHPNKNDVPTKYQRLIDWYLEQYRTANGNRPPKSNNPSVFLSFVGTFSAFDLREMAESIEEGFERVDANEW
jgi:hypothetical protein